MRVLVTGAGGFVGSNVVHEAAKRGTEIVGVVRSPPPRPEPGCAYEIVDLLEPDAIGDVVSRVQPDAIVHTAILNDARLLHADRRLAWGSYVGVTRTLADAANVTGSLLVTVSTDWVFDGTQAGADEQTPPNPINYYGVLKLASELVTLERAAGGAVARISGVMGLHRARPSLPRGQDAGFGYFVASLVDALEVGSPFIVWESDAINMRATPSLASHSAGLMLDLCDRRLDGVFHCCGAEGIGRMELALVAAEVFGLDPSLLRSGPPDPAALPPDLVPYDTTLDATATASALGVTLPSIHGLLEAFRDERSA